MDAKRSTAERTLLWSAVALAALVSPAGVTEAAPATPQFESFATPYLFDRRVRGYVCYIGNLGRTTVSVRRFRIRSVAGILDLTSDTCPGTDPFTLKSGMSCAIGTAGNGDTAACLAESDDVSVLRGSLQSRDQNGKVLRTARITPGTGGSQPLASPPMYGGLGENTASCLLLNVGTVTAVLSDVRLVTSTGQTFLPHASCFDARQRGTAAGQLTPGGYCSYDQSSIPPNDLQCRAQASNRSIVRGSFGIGKDTQVFNEKSLR